MYEYLMFLKFELQSLIENVGMWLYTKIPIRSTFLPENIFKINVWHIFTDIRHKKKRLNRQLVRRK